MQHTLLGLLRPHLDPLGVPPTHRRSVFQVRERPDGAWTVGSTTHRDTAPSRS